MQFFRFCIVGVIGFVVDAGVFQLFFAYLHVGPFLARIPSFAAAASITWILNRHFTFRVKHQSSRAEWLLYTVAMLLGATMNYGAFALSVTHWSTVHSYPMLGIAIGSIAGLLMNFMSSRFVFRYLRRMHPQSAQ